MWQLMICLKKSDLSMVNDHDNEPRAKSQLAQLLFRSMNTSTSFLYIFSSSILCRLQGLRARTTAPILIQFWDKYLTPKFSPDRKTKTRSHSSLLTQVLMSQHKEETILQLSSTEPYLHQTSSTPSHGL